MPTCATVRKRIMSGINVRALSTFPTSFCLRSLSHLPIPPSLLMLVFNVRKRIEGKWLAEELILNFLTKWLCVYRIEFMESREFLRIESMRGAARVQIPVTNPVVMRTTSTQPGTSPLSPSTFNLMRRYPFWIPPKHLSLLLFITFFIYSPSASFRLLINTFHWSEFDSDNRGHHPAHRFSLYLDWLS